MSILSSTKTGVRAYVLQAKDLLDRGYRTNADKSTFYYKEGFKHYLHRVLNAQGEVDYYSFGFSMKGNLYNFKIRNVLELKAIERIWDAKNEKDRINKQKALVKIALEYRTANLGKKVKISQ